MSTYTKETFIKKLNETYPFINFTFGEENDEGHIQICANGIPLKAVWSKELDKDLNSYWSIKPEDEIESLMFEYIGIEIISRIMYKKYVNPHILKMWFDEEN